MNLPDNAPSGQVIDHSLWHRHEVQTLSGSNLGVSCTTSYTKCLLIDNRRIRNNYVMFYNQDGATAITVRVIGTIYNPGEDEPSYTDSSTNDVSWEDLSGEEICEPVVVAAASQSAIIPVEGLYTWIVCEAKSASGTVLVNAYYRGSN